MHHTVDLAGKANKEPKLGDVLDVAFDLAADSEVFLEGVPGIVAALLEAEADATLLLIDIKHHHLHLLRGRDDLARMDVFLGPTHLGHVDEPLDTGFQLDEGAVVGNVCDPAGEPGADRILGTNTLPRIGFQLFHAEGNALGFRVEADDLNVDLLADGKRLAGVVDPLPGNIGDVQQAVDAAQIDEGAVIGDVFHHTLQHLALGQVGDQLGTLLGPGLFEHRTARDHDVAARAVHLEDLEGLRRAHQGANVAHRPDIDLTAWQEGYGAGEIHGKAALDPTKYDAGHALTVAEGLLKLGPSLFALGLFPAEHGLAVLVLHALDIDFDLVPDFDFRDLTAFGEFLQGNPPFGLQANVDYC